MNATILSSIVGFAGTVWTIVQWRGASFYQGSVSIVNVCIKGTVAEDLIPEDRGHHLALCNVPDVKTILRERSMRSEGGSEDIQKMQGGECRQVKSTKKHIV
ncbi:hypothetical protein NECAME_14735 [Necator americanus]|uniref:Uncharacterized protein n=1 Tax=Necator americanus TaxID=51031 RepID=W2SP81_NECAM|nr:hypothetical protein NECAME_14735 [Necator americanus]ETN70512.1 hypothetical protein NECAME_14735 [Necator americanus]